MAFFLNNFLKNNGLIEVFGTIFVIKFHLPRQTKNVAEPVNRKLK